MRDTMELYFNVESGKLVISDPCYSPGTLGYHEVKAANGQWLAEVRYRDEGEWGIRVSSLFAVNTDYDDSYDDHEMSYIDDLGVDSGQMSIWDGDYYSNDDPQYELIGYGDGTDSPANGTLSEDKCYRDDSGVACQSGYGDGIYEAECYHLDDDRSPIIAVSIRFI